MRLIVVMTAKKIRKSLSSFANTHQFPRRTSGLSIETSAVHVEPILIFQSGSDLKQGFAKFHADWNYVPGEFIGHWVLATRFAKLCNALEYTKIWPRRAKRSKVEVICVRIKIKEMAKARGLFKIKLDLSSGVFFAVQFNNLKHRMYFPRTLANVFWKFCEYSAQAYSQNVRNSFQWARLISFLIYLFGVCISSSWLRRLLIGQCYS